MRGRQLDNVLPFTRIASPIFKQFFFMISYTSFSCTSSVHLTFFWNKTIDNSPVLCQQRSEDLCIYTEFLYPTTACFHWQLLTTLTLWVKNVILVLKMPTFINEYLDGNYYYCESPQPVVSGAFMVMLCIRWPIPWSCH